MPQQDDIRSGFGLKSLPAVILLLVMCVGAIHVILRVFMPPAHIPTQTPVYNYDMTEMLNALDWREVRKTQQAILNFGSRYMGQPGFYKTEQYIQDIYTEAGLEVYIQHNWTVVPKTDYREVSLVSESQKPLDDVEIYPFMPNHLQPMTTPEEGITGELVVMTSETLSLRESFNDCIALIDASEDRHSPDYGFDWSKYASLGVKAVIVAHPEGLEKIDWKLASAERGGMVANVPANFVRLAATKEILNYSGQKINLKVRTRFKNTPNSTIIGVLRAGKTSRKKPSKTALLVLTNYDASSILPDLAPGSAQAVPLATQLALVKGMSQYKETLVRDVIFVAFGAQVMARDGDNNLLKVLDENILSTQHNPLKQLITSDTEGTSDEREMQFSTRVEARHKPWQKRHDKNKKLLLACEKILASFENPAFLVDAKITNEITSNFDKITADLFDEQTTYVLDEIVFQLFEPQFQAKLKFLHSQEQDLEGPEFTDYQIKKQLYDSAVSASGYSLNNLLESEEFGKEFLKKYNVRNRWQARFDELRNHHIKLAQHLSDNLALLDIFAPYRKLIVFDNKTIPSPNNDVLKESLSFFDGAWGVNSQMREMSSLLSSARQRVASIRPNIVSHNRFDIPTLNKWHSADVDRMTRPVSNMSATEWTSFGYHMYTMLSFDRVESYQKLYAPVDLPFMHDVESLAGSMATFGEMLLSVAHGNGRFAPIQLGWLKKHFGGRIYASGVGQSMTPHFPLKDCFLAARSFYGIEYTYPGFWEHPIIMTDPYGRYELFNCASDFWVNHYIWKYGYSPIAAMHGDDGVITWMKDEGENGQRLYKSVNINWFDAKVDDINIVLFRAAPVSILDLTNPQKLTEFSGVRVFDRFGLSEVGRYCHFRETPIDGAWTSFVEPERLIYIAFESGSPGNDLAKVIRGFLLGTPGDNEKTLFVPDPEKEIDGPGFFPATTPLISDVPRKMARSMSAINGKRLALQQAYNMADEQVIDYAAKADALLEKSEKPDQPQAFASLEAKDSVTYSMLNHPVLRKTITEAVAGILYYLALLVPFVFFFEKMLFCNTDIRKQLAAQAVIFLVVFFLLRVLHPAFGMVRSSLMILLGFVIILISGSMTILFTGKFKQNLEELKKMSGQVSEAQINKLGVISTSFMLGLNNMHRRKMRTFLTCGTLILLTLAMICFTSTHTNIVNEQKAIGKAAWQGVLIKRENFQRLTGAEIFTIQSKYKHKFEVCPRVMSLGIQNWLDKQGYNPELEIVYDTTEQTRNIRFQSIIKLTHADPIQYQLELITKTPWFLKSHETQSADELCPVLIPDSMAEKLGIKVKDVESGNAKARINGRTFLIYGIFSAQSLADVRDLDGRDILPYDIENMSQIHVLEDGEVVADENSPRISPDKIILAPLRDLGIQIPNEKPDSNVSLALYMPEGDYREIKSEIDTYLEQSERPAYYGLDGIAYHGQRTRKASMSGMLELIVPLLIAALTVLNTMKGSVYERRGEIAIYNAVGVAPRYVFFMFIAEAFVYVVVGTMLGYLLSQATGTILTMLNMTGGLNMTFTSITTIYASLAVGATVFLSTWFPARTAMEIAKPTEDAGWTLPEPEGDILTFDLPFTFSPRDRIAVLAFCRRFLDDHGEGGTGKFHAGESVLEIAPNLDPLDEDGYIPRIKTTIWLKPYDLGVSQDVTINMVMDEDTGEYKARVELQRLGGSQEAWIRLNKTFVAEIRRRLLFWRAVSELDRKNLFEEGRMIFQSAVNT